MSILINDGPDGSYVGFVEIADPAGFIRQYRLRNEGLELLCALTRRPLLAREGIYQVVTINPAMPSVYVSKLAADALGLEQVVQRLRLPGQEMQKPPAFSLMCS